MPEDDAQRPIAHDAARIGIVEPFLHPHFGRDEAGVKHPVEDEDRDIHVVETRTEHRDDRDNQHQKREGDDGIDDTAEDRLHDIA